MNILTDRRQTSRRASDERNEHFKGVLMIMFLMTLLTGVAFGYYLGAAEAAAIVVGAK